MLAIDYKSERTKDTSDILDSTHLKKVVIAGPGTGKSYLFAELIRKKREQGKSDFLAITFVGKLGDSLADDLCGLAKTTTMHSFARDFVLKYSPDAFIFWHSKANAVYASECEAGILPETLEIMTAYSSAAGYNAVKTFDAYEITGDAEGWLASKNIPAITVELQTHETIEWEKNLAGIKALFEHYQP